MVEGAITFSTDRQNNLKLFDLS